MMLSESTRTDSDPHEGSVREVLRAAGEGTLALVAGRTDAPVTAAEYFELEHDSPQPGVLWLLPGWRHLKRLDLERVLDVVARRSSAGLVVQDAQHDAVVAALGDAPVTVLRLHPDVSWRQFQALVEHALGERASVLPGAIPASEVLFGLANDVAEAFGGSVAIENHQRTMLAYSTREDSVIDDFRRQGILSRRPPDVDRNDPQYRHVLRHDDIARFPSFPGELPRAAIAVRAAGIPLGTIWAIDPSGDDLDQPLAPGKRAALIEAARAASAVLVDAWRFDDSAARLRHDALRRIVLGELVGGEREELDLDEGAIRLVAVSWSMSAVDGALGGRVRAFVERRLAATWADAVALTIAGTVYALITEDDLESVVEAAERLRGAVETGLDSAVAVAVTNAADALADGVSLRAEADALLRVARAEAAVSAELLDRHGEVERPRVATVSSRAAGLLVDALHAQSLDFPALGHHAIRDSLARGGEKERELRETVCAWLDAAGSAAATAAALGLHENSVRYRVRQAAAAWGVDLGDADTRFAVWVALRLERYREGLPAARSLT